MPVRQYQQILERGAALRPVRAAGLPVCGVNHDGDREGGPLAAETARRRELRPLRAEAEPVRLALRRLPAEGEEVPRMRILVSGSTRSVREVAALYPSHVGHLTTPANGNAPKTLAATGLPWAIGG